MAEPIPPADNVESALRHASEQLRALKKAKPQNAAEARLQSAELVRLQGELISATHRATDAAAAKRVNGHSNGHAKGKASAADPFSDEVLNELAKGLVGWIGPILDDIEKRIGEIERKKGIAPLAARLGTLEATATKYRGIWKDEETYAAGSLCTFQGGLWHCTDSNVGVRPGSGSSSWTLANKSRR